MTNIHFIWWGPPPSTSDKIGRQNCLKFPSDITKVISSENLDVELIFWCQEAFAGVFKNAFQKDYNVKITPRNCSSVQEIVGDLYVGEFGLWMHLAQNNIMQLNSSGVGIAVKDLLSLIIPYCYGGFYFDTTMVLDDSRQLVNALKSPPKVPKVTDISEGKSFLVHQPLLETEKAIKVGFDWSDNEYQITVPHIDVWAYYSTKKVFAFELAMKSYIRRCNRLGLYPGGKSIIGLDKEGVNLLIGNLSVRSVLDGFLLASYANENYDQFEKRYLWKATSGDQVTVNGRSYKNTFKVSDLGIRKYYANEWR